jgi:malonate transporter
LSAILNSVVPLFAVIFLGYFAGRAGIFGEAGIRGLGAFVFNFAIPPYVFRLMAGTDLEAIGEWRFLGGYFAAQVLIFAAAAGLGRLVFGMRLPAMTIQGFGSVFSNGVMLGLPLLVWVYGERGGVPALLIITLDVLVFSAVTVLLELGRRTVAGAGAARLVAQAVRSILVNPILMGTILGILFGLSGLALPELVDRTVAFIGQAAAPSALFALGATLSLRRLGGHVAPAGFMIAAKLLVHPLLAWVVFSQVLDLPPLWVNAGVLFAACPVGLNVFIFAQHYETAVETASSAILISTGLAMLTITALLAILPPITP